MGLRTNNVLKFFVLLLFSLEFMAPAILVDAADAESNQDKVQLLDGAHRQNILFSIFSEELTENEEGREGQKDTILFEDLSFVFNFLHAVAAEPTSCKYSSFISDQFDTQPALFKLNCTFLI